MSRSSSNIFGNIFELPTEETSQEEDPFQKNLLKEIIQKIQTITGQTENPQAILDKELSNITTEPEVLKINLASKICQQVGEKLECPENQLVLLFYLSQVFDRDKNKYQQMFDVEKAHKQELTTAYADWLLYIQNIYKQVMEMSNEDDYESLVKMILEKSPHTVEFCKALIPNCQKGATAELEKQCESNNFLSVLTDPCVLEDIIIDPQGKITRCCLPVDEKYLTQKLGELTVSNKDLVIEIIDVNKRVNLSY
jgi:hypothetical protein